MCSLTFDAAPLLLPTPPLTAVTDVLLTSAASPVLSHLCKSKTLEEEEHQQKQRWPQPKLIVAAATTRHA